MTILTQSETRELMLRDSIRHDLDSLILRTPTGPRRNLLTMAQLLITASESEHAAAQLDQALSTKPE